MIFLVKFVFGLEDFILLLAITPANKYQKYRLLASQSPIYLSSWTEYFLNPFISSYLADFSPFHMVPGEARQLHFKLLSTG